MGILEKIADIEKEIREGKLFCFGGCIIGGSWLCLFSLTVFIK
jgi:hypothetical protein